MSTRLWTSSRPRLNRARPPRFPTANTWIGSRPTRPSSTPRLTARRRAPLSAGDGAPPGTPFQTGNTARSCSAGSSKADADAPVVPALVVDLEDAYRRRRSGRAEMRSPTGLPVETDDLDHPDLPVGRR